MADQPAPFASWAGSESVDELVARPDFPREGWESSRGRQAQTAAFVVAARQLEQTVKDIDRASKRVTLLSVILAGAAVILTAVQVWVAVRAH